MKNIRILLIDDHAMFRSGLRMVLNGSLPQAVINEAGSLNEAMQLTVEQPDAVLLDIKLPGLNGVDGIALIRRRWPLVPVIMLSSQDEPETVRMALARGASCFISKAETADRIVSLLESVVRGEIIAPLDQASHGADTSGTLLHLTPRQCEVLDLLCKGLSNKLIARQLDLSENTVRGHVQAILGFLQVSSRTEAAFAARNRGLVS
jgi:DNA-binding NarL/FixJ family response regulator